MKKGPKAPREDPSVAVMRERQIRDLAELDEEENRRMKAAFKVSRGVRAFRPSAAGGAGSASSGGGSGSRAAVQHGRNTTGARRTV